MKNCNHPKEKQFSWLGRNDNKEFNVLNIRCAKCNKIIYIGSVNQLLIKNLELFNAIKIVDSNVTLAREFLR